ncbi:dipeptidase 1 isoform X2 [Diabrotica virgifera virgifera]|nr:dipeptidase 1 isoform X2 [Diabrotica virgifera virgifera]
MGSTTALGKPEPPGSPPYYRSTSATSSSSNSASSRGIDLTNRHWWLIGTVLLLAAAAGVGVPIALKISSSASFEERLEFATRLLQEVPLIDGHNDLPWNIRKFLHNKLKNFKFNEDLRNVSPWSTSAWSHTDLVRLEQGHVAAQFWAAYVPCDSQYKDAVQLTLEQIDVIRRLTDQYNPRLTLCTSSEEIKSAYKRRQLCSLIGVEGGHSLAGSLAVLRTLYHVGVRYLTLTSTCNTPWADCSHADLPGKKPEHGGLTNFGKSVIKEMNRLGMIVDLSHVSVNTMRDALEVSKAPVIFSHSSAHALCNSTRNVPDDTLRKLAMNKGVIMVNFYSLFLTCKEVSTIADAVAHINHIREVAGVDSVGIGAGYDGINYVPQGLEDVSSYPTLFAELIGTGKWTVDDLKKLAGLNFLRVFQEAEKIRDEFKKANVPPYEDVMPKPKDTNCSSQIN